MRKSLLILLAIACCGCQKMKQDKNEKVQYTIHAKNGSMTADELTLRDTEPHVQASAAQKTVRISKESFVKHWSEAFSSNPSATIAYQDSDKHEQKETVELSNPHMENGAIVFSIKPAEEMKNRAKRELGETTVSIDGGKRTALPQVYQEADSSAVNGMNGGEKKCELPKCSAKKDEPVEYEDKKCTIPTCKPKVEPEPEEEEKECTLPTCKPKVEPEPEEEEKECTLPTCKPKQEPMEEEESECDNPRCSSCQGYRY